MNLKKKISILALASTLCLAVGAVCVNTQTTTASADEATGAMTMAAGAAVNKTSDYGGIRWTTTVEQNFQPVSGTTAYNFGTFVIPTATYEAEKAADATKKIEDMQGAMNIRYKYDAQSESWTALDTAESGFTYYSAIKYDDIVEDYKNTYQNTTKTDADILKAAYKLELTAVSYAYDGTTYHYVDVTDVSRSARQVANAALLAGELEADQGVEASVKTTVQGYVGGAENIVTGTTSAGYLDLTEIKAGTEQTLTVDKSAYTDLDWANVQEIAVGAKGVEKSVDTDTDTITIAEAPEDLTTYENGKFAYVAAFTADGVYNIPAIAADGVISTWEDVVDKLGNETDKTQSGYYVVTGNIEAVAEGDYTTDIVRASATKATATTGLIGVTLDGQGYTISGFTTTYGLFGYIRNSTVKNLGVVGGINNVAYASLLATRADSTTFDNVYVKASSFGGTKGYSTVACRMVSVSLNNCLIDATKNAVSGHALPFSNGYHLNAPGSVSTASAYSDVTYTNTYVLSGLPLVYQSSSTSASSTCDEEGVTKTVNQYYVTSAKMYDTLLETDIVGDKATAMTATDFVSKDAETVQAEDLRYAFVVRSAEVDGMTTLANSANVKTTEGVSVAGYRRFSVAVSTAAFKVTKPVYYTGYTTSDAGRHNRYYYYETYTQLTGVKRYENASLMAEDAANNATELATYDTNYWTVNTANGTLTWKNA